MQQKVMTLKARKRIRKFLRDMFRMFASSKS